MSQARAIQIVNQQGVSGFSEQQRKTLRKLVDVVYADLAAGADPATLAGLLLSSDANNDIELGSDDLLYYNAP